MPAFHHLALWLGLGLAVAACGHGHDNLGPPTGTACPPASTLTYADFGMAFMATYCVECHDSAKSGAEREGAPLFHDFDTQAGIQAVADHVDQMAGSGPDATNTLMPPAAYLPKPTLAERVQLAEWIACGAP